MNRVRIDVIKIENRLPYTPQMYDIYINNGDTIVGEIILKDDHEVRIYFSDANLDHNNYITLGLLKHDDLFDGLNTTGGQFKVRYLNG